MDSSNVNHENETDMIAHEQIARVRFFGNRSAELFTREIEESFEGVLRRNLMTGMDGHPGFVSASLDGRPWTDTMWPRDTGVFLRELVHWGCLGYACLVAECLMGMVRKNEQGFNTFPEYFRLGEPASGHEFDGTAAVIIGLIKLYRRLSEEHPTRETIYNFLHAESSPVRYVTHVLQSHPLIPGSGEFGGGCGIEGLYMNVVQNNLARLTLLDAAVMEIEAGDSATAETYIHNAEKLEAGINRYLIDDDGCWIWCVDPETLQPDPEILNHTINKGFGGLNGPACMFADVLGFEPLISEWDEIDVCLKTFIKLFNTPLRREQFEKYGMWTQFDEFLNGYETGPSYGHGYALQTMLLFDKLDLADKAMAYLAEATYRLPRGYKLDRESPYWFYERYYSSDSAGVIDWDQGCGALNLVCVAEPLKVARLIVGVDDTNPENTLIIPRLPSSWSGYETENWPVHTLDGVVRVDISYRQAGSGCVIRVNVKDGKHVPKLTLKLGTPSNRTVHELNSISSIDLESES